MEFVAIFRRIVTLTVAHDEEPQAGRRRCGKFSEGTHQIMLSFARADRPDRQHEQGAVGYAQLPPRGLPRDHSQLFREPIDIESIGDDGEIAAPFKVVPYGPRGPGNEDHPVGLSQRPQRPGGGGHGAVEEVGVPVFALVNVPERRCLGLTSDDDCPGGVERIGMEHLGAAVADHLGELRGNRLPHRRSGNDDWQPRGFTIGTQPAVHRREDDRVDDPRLPQASDQVKLTQRSPLPVEIVRDKDRTHRLPV